MITTSSTGYYSKYSPFVTTFISAIAPYLSIVTLPLYVPINDKDVQKPISSTTTDTIVVISSVALFFAFFREATPSTT